MKLKIAFATATALGLLAATAWAGDGNKSYVSQQGDFNKAFINQNAGNNNQAGSAARTITQVGSTQNIQSTKNNELEITQSGNSNSVGLDANANSFGNSSGIHQRQAYGGTSSYASSRNVIDIDQTSDGNRVGAVSQYTATHVGDNKLLIVQRGLGNNTVGSVSQYRTQTTQNVANIDQAGQNNTIARVEQYVNGYGGPAAEQANRFIVSMTGNNNGNSQLSGAAAASGAQSSTLIQGSPANPARDNYASQTISGNDNQFGVSQFGVSNTVGNLLISGNDNQVGTYQRGNRNTVSLAEVGGHGNDIGIRQTGDDNLAGTTVDGNDNRLAAKQDGANNVISALVAGNNNGGGLFTDLGASTLASGAGLTSGDLSQIGSNNNIGLTVSSSQNQFAFLQSNGNGNQLSATIGGGNGNQAVGVQSGSNNTATLNQTGGSNVAVFQQVGSGNTGTLGQ